MDARSSTVPGTNIVLRLRGGGGDGGATGAESRDCYLSMYLDKKPDKYDTREVQLARATKCLLSAEDLNPPCACDLLGNVFNKDAVVQALVTKTMPSKLSHIRGLKDIVTIHFGENLSAASTGATGALAISRSDIRGYSGFASRSSSVQSAAYNCFLSLQTRAA